MFLTLWVPQIVFKAKVALVYPQEAKPEQQICLPGHIAYPMNICLTDKLTDRQADRQTDGHTDRWKYRQMDIQIYKQTDRQRHIGYSMAEAYVHQSGSPEDNLAMHF